MAWSDILFDLAWSEAGSLVPYQWMVLLLSLPSCMHIFVNWINVAMNFAAGATQCTALLGGGLRCHFRHCTLVAPGFTLMGHECLLGGALRGSGVSFVLELFEVSLTINDEL